MTYGNMTYDIMDCAKFFINIRSEKEEDRIKSLHEDISILKNGCNSNSDSVSLKAPHVTWIPGGVIT